MGLTFTCLVIVNMASPQRSESPPPAKKRCKSPEFDFVSAPKVAKNASEFGPQPSAGPRKSLSKFFAGFLPPVKFSLCLLPKSKMAPRSLGGAKGIQGRIGRSGRTVKTERESFSIIQ